MAKKLTIDISDDVMVGLDRLANRSSVSSASLASQALSAYVANELEIVRGIERGLSDLEAGRVVSHQDAMEEINTLISNSPARR
ncbi:CopG family transcriptional regulator [Neorhizobium alkalisoli]|uniref:Putative transcriptional regulator n=1 Tax=Neorhizobium alkalisoli TaxID=528178 RepID=A0A561R1L6_9HYPH|nr:CopG family transcriptional regulator [Neorhizobium alkalisoli]TWF56507.1 putative transcriptional regulator [Neorhizobium alkalisoli]